MRFPMIAVLIAGVAWLSPSLAGQPSCAADMIQAASMRNQAVALARNNQYDQALSLCRKLADAGYEDPGFWADYLTILSWAGKEKDMINLAEIHYSQGFASLPDYTLKPLAQAYAHQGMTSKADGVYALLVGRNGVGSDKSYELDYQRALDAMNRKDYVEGERYFSQAKAEAPSWLTQYSRDVDAKRAALYIQQGEAGRAVRILQPYVKQKQALPHMFSDYLMALRLDNKMKEAVKTFENYSDWQQLPAYGQQTMGDIYLRSGKYRQAHKLYDYILQHNSSEPMPYVLLGDAYAQVMMGREAEGVAQYAKALKVRPALAGLIAGDGAAFLRNGQLHVARQVYDLLGHTPAERQNWALQYGQALVRVDRDFDNGLSNFFRDNALDGRNYYFEAHRVLQPLTQSTNPDIRVSAQAALAQNELQKGRFATAEKKIASLLQQDNDAPDVLDVSAKNEVRENNYLSLYYGSHIDNKRNHESNLGFDYSGYIGHNFYALAGMEWNRLQDGTLHSSYVQRYGGVSWEHPHGQIKTMYDDFGSDWKNGYTLSASYDVNDISGWTYAMGRKPHDAAGAVDDRILENFHSLRWDFIPAARWRLGLEYGWSRLTDGNHYWQAGLDGSYALGGRHNYWDTIPFAISRSHYDDQTDAYDSPYRSVNYGIGWSRSWYDKKNDRVWRWTNMVNTGHDDDERSGISPSSRLELIQNLPHNQRLRAAIQYNWYFHQDPDAAWNRRNHGYLFEAGYEIGW